MSADILTNMRLIHLIIDPQEGYLPILSGKTRVAEYLNDLRNFSDALYDFNIPTLIVGCHERRSLRKFEFYTTPDTIQAAATRLRIAFLLRDGEHLFEKGDENG